MKQPGAAPGQDPEIVAIIVAEAREHLHTVEDALLSLEATPSDRALINEIFRLIHTVKGNAGFLSHEPLKTLSHDAESVLDLARKERLTVDAEVIDVLLAAVDGLKWLIEEVASHDKVTSAARAGNPLPGPDIASITNRLHALVDRAPVPGAGPSGPPGPAPPPVPPAEPIKLGEILVAEGAVTPEALDRALAEQARPVGQILVEQGAASLKLVQEALGKQQAQWAQAQGPTREAIKVNLHRLDALIDLVGELNIAYVMLLTQRNTLGSQNGSAALFDKLLHRFGKLSSDIQDRAMGLRMVPIKPTFQKMRRLVRDLAQKAQKDVVLTLAGEATEIDKTVVEQLADPLVHLMRNALDHGLESSDERVAAGKLRQGTIHLEAFHAAGEVVLEVRDDGRGIDLAKVRAKAEAQGLVAPGTQLTELQTYNLLFLPGFSTAAQVTDISGRGVGMDVVKTNIDRLRGRIEVESTPGRGTQLRIRLPLTMAVIDGMVVEVGAEQYVIPVLNVVQSLRPTRAQVSTVLGRGECLLVRDEVIPLVRLHHLYNLRPRSKEPWQGLTVIVQTEGSRAALLVDEIRGQQQVVVKPLGQTYSYVRGVSGASIMGDGRVALILDISTLLDPAHTNAPCLCQRSECSEAAL